jgi:hypothetical protein
MRQQNPHMTKYQAARGQSAAMEHTVLASTGAGRFHTVAAGNWL